MRSAEYDEGARLRAGWSPTSVACVLGAEMGIITLVFLTPMQLVSQSSQMMPVKAT